MADDKAPALSEGLRLLEMIAHSGEGIAQEDLLKGTKMSKSSTLRMLRVLGAEGFIRQTEKRMPKYLLDVRSLLLFGGSRELGHAAVDLESELLAIAERFNCSLQIGKLVMSSKKIIILMTAESLDAVKVGAAGLDITFCACRHGMGKAILAHLEAEQRSAILELSDGKEKTPNSRLPGKALDEELGRIAMRGEALEKEECSLGLFRLAYPLFDVKGKIQGALCASWQDRSFKRSRADEIRRAISECLALPVLSSHFEQRRA